MKRGIVMFDQENIVGCSIHNIDYKNRLMLPDYCNAEVGEELVLLSDDDFFSIYSVTY